MNDGVNDREARNICDRIVQHMADGDVYRACDEIDRVHARGVVDGRKPIRLTIEQQISIANEELRDAESEVEARRAHLDKLTRPPALRLAVTRG